MIGCIEIAIAVVLIWIGAPLKLLIVLMLGCMGILTFLSFKTPSPSERGRRTKTLRLLVEKHGISYDPKEDRDEDTKAGS